MSHKGNPRDLHPKYYAGSIATDHGERDEAPTKRDCRGAEPGIGADRLSQERVAQDLKELGEWVELNNEMILARKEVGLPHHRRDIEHYHQPCGDNLND